jgi:hypothetical protein
MARIPTARPGDPQTPPGGHAATDPGPFDASRSSPVFLQPPAETPVPRLLGADGRRWTRVVVHRRTRVRLRVAFLGCSSAGPSTPVDAQQPPTVDAPVSRPMRPRWCQLPAARYCSTTPSGRPPRSGSRLTHRRGVLAAQVELVLGLVEGEPHGRAGRRLAVQVINQYDLGPGSHEPEGPAVIRKSRSKRHGE